MEPNIGYDLPIGQQCPVDTELNALRDALAALDATHADVRLKCADGRLRIGFFPGRIPTSAELSQARDKGLARVDLITSRPQGAERIALGAIRVRPEVTELLEQRTGPSCVTRSRRRP